MVQWLRFCAPNAGGLGSVPGQGTRSHMQQLKLGTVKKKKKSSVGAVSPDDGASGMVCALLLSPCWPWEVVPTIANPVLPQWLLWVEWFWHREEKNEDVGSNIPVVLYLVEQKFKTSPVLEKSVPKMKPAQRKAAWSRVRLLWSFELHYWAFLHLLISLLVS